MDREDAIDYITRMDWRRSRLGLERITALLGLLGDPQDGLRFIHIAGTNGKSSTSAMLAQVLRQAGCRVGLFTSPYVNCFNERMQVDGRMVTDSELAEVTGYVRGCAEGMEDHPTEFELVTAIAFEWYRRKACDIVVLEVGLGGRLDATNVIPTPELAVVTTIALDHTVELGDTLEQIAGEKAGIIKAGGDVVLYPQPPGVLKVFEDACAAQGARLHPVDFSSLEPQSATLEGQRFRYAGMEDLRVRLLGPYQAKNAATVITAARVLREKGWDITDAAIRRGLAEAFWPARFELVHRRPDVIVDGGHNPQCAEALVEGLERYYPGRKMLLVTGVMADKDYPAAYGLLLPYVRRVYCVAPDNPRALPAGELAAFFRAAGVRDAGAYADVLGGVWAAMAEADTDDLVCCFGSFYMAGQIRGWFLDGE